MTLATRPQGDIPRLSPGTPALLLQPAYITDEQAALLADLAQEAAELRHDEHMRLATLTMGAIWGNDDCDACVRQAEGFWSGCE